MTEQVKADLVLEAEVSPTCAEKPSLLYLVYLRCSKDTKQTSPSVHLTRLLLSKDTDTSRKPLYQML